MAGEDLKTQLASLLGLGQPAPSGGASPAAAPPAAPPPAAAPAQPPPAAATPGAPALDYDALAGALVKALGAGGQQTSQQAPQGGRPPTMTEILQGLGAAAQPGPQVGTPRVVRRMEQDNGLVDVFALNDAEVDAMPIEQLVGHFERARDAARRSTGAPLLPRALRGKQGR